MFRINTSMLRVLFARTPNASDRAALMKDVTLTDPWSHAPVGTSKRTAAQCQRASKKRKAQRRARRLGHA